MLDWLDRDFAEKLFFLSQAVLMPAIALYAFRYAGMQILEARKIAEQTRSHAEDHHGILVSQGCARVILELLNQWDAPKMIDARNIIVALHRELMSEATYTHPLPQVFSDRLRKMRAENDPSYSQILKFCSFYEAAGVMVKQNYVPLADIAALFSGSIIFMDDCCSQHIHERQKEKGVTPGLYEHALYLVEQIKALEAKTRRNI